MLFYTFHSQDERRKFGGSAFIEMQLCKMGPEAEITQLTAVSNIDHWQNDSLYIYLDDIETFAAEYRNIFNCAIYGNLESGPADLYLSLIHIFSYPPHPLPSSRYPLS